MWLISLNHWSCCTFELSCFFQGAHHELKWYELLIQKYSKEMSHVFIQSFKLKESRAHIHGSLAGLVQLATLRINLVRSQKYWHLFWPHVVPCQRCCCPRWFARDVGARYTWSWGDFGARMDHQDELAQEKLDSEAEWRARGEEHEIHTTVQVGQKLCVLLYWERVANGQVPDHVLQRCCIRRSGGGSKDRFHGDGEAPSGNRRPHPKTKRRRQRFTPTCLRQGADASFWLGCWSSWSFGSQHALELESLRPVDWIPQSELALPAPNGLEGAPGPGVWQVQEECQKQAQNIAQEVTKEAPVWITCEEEVTKAKEAQEAHTFQQSDRCWTWKNRCCSQSTPNQPWLEQLPSYPAVWKWIFLIRWWLKCHRSHVVWFREICFWSQAVTVLSGILLASVHRLLLVRDEAFPTLTRLSVDAQNKSSSWVHLELDV